MQRSTSALFQQSQKFSLLAGLFTIGLALSACGGSKKASTPPVDNTPNTPSNSAGGQRDPLGKRYCDIELTSTLSLSNWESRFAQLFQWDVDGFEDAPTLCADLDSYGEQLSGAIMIEYEDSQGIGYLALDESVLFFGEIKRNSTTKIELIYNFSIDGVGFLLQIKGQNSSSSGPIKATIRYHQLASYQDQVNEAIKEAQKKCKDGTWTVAQCLGYNFPSSYWWEDSNNYTSAQDQQVEMARQLLGNTSKSKELGKTEFKLSKVMK